MSSKKLPEIILKKGQQRRVRAGHPWVFSNELEMTPEAKALTPGTIVKFVDAGAEIMGTGFFNPHSLIAGRIVSRGGAMIDGALLESRLRAALALRERLYTAPYYRLVHSEADGLPGLIVDRYNDFLVVQINAAGMELLWDELHAALQAVISPTAILLKNEGPSRKLEGLTEETRWVGDEPAAPQTLIEGGVTFRVDMSGGQKTGWFFDQAANRAMVASLAKGARVLDLYSYLGGFGLEAAKAGAAAVTLIDRSEPALDLTAQTAAANDLGGLCTFHRGNVFIEAERLAAEGVLFDIVIADPPAFVKSRRDIKTGSRGYRKLARLSAALVAPGGLLFTASCSHHMPVDQFAEQIRRGISDAGRSARILYSTGAGPDHPVHPHLPESAYLKAQLLQLD
jgi:23S rRNA (cytosine1962-C5)-methyltransferase